MKACRCCQKELPEANFYRRSDYPDRVHSNCKSCQRAIAKARYPIKREEILSYKKDFHRKNPEKAKLKGQAFRAKRPDYQTSRYREEPLIRLKACMRTRIRQVLVRDGYRKGSRSEEIIGCSFDELKKHLERQFSEGMCWANYGAWHVDHKVPLASAETEEAMISLCHYRNLQPLWAIDNFRKGAKMMEAA